MPFQGKAVYITGASSGIGRALAIEFAGRGARVGVTARRTDELIRLCEEIRGRGQVAFHAPADATDRESVRTAFARLAEELGPCDVLIANAGVGHTNSRTNLNIPGAESVIRTNLLGPMYAMDAVLGDMLKRGSGHLVGISSVAAFKGLPGAAAYSASKAGLNSYLESVRISLWGSGIAVTAICPGFVRTAMTEKNPRMPWVMNADKAARLIVRAVERRKKVYSFPRRMRWLIGLTRYLPDRWVTKMVME